MKEHNSNKEGTVSGTVSASKSTSGLSGAFESRAKGGRGVEAPGRAGGEGQEQEPSALATLRDKIRTIGAAGERGTISDRFLYNVLWCTVVQPDQVSFLAV